MSKNNKKKETGLYNKDKTDITLNNNSEEYLFIRSRSIKDVNMKKIQFYNNYQMNQNENEEDVPLPKIRRSNSVDLYKKHKEKKLKKNNENTNYNIIDNNPEKDKKIKKVTFLQPTFVTIIDVESYKKYKQENTSKDPYGDLINNNNNNDKKIQDDQKEQVVCCCFIV